MYTIEIFLIICILLLKIYLFYRNIFNNMYTIEIFFIVHIFTIEIFFIIFSASGTSKTKINYLKEKKFFSFLYKKKKKCVF